jgi:hypothetical protein
MSIVKYNSVSEGTEMKSKKEGITKTIERAFSIVRDIPGLTNDFKVAAFEVLLRYELESEKKVSQLGPTQALTGKKPTKGTLIQRISELIAEGFFATPRSGSEVRDELKNRGYHYSNEAVLMSMLHSVRRRDLRRIMETGEGKKQYSYVNP